MLPISLLEKLNILKEVIISSSLYLVILGIIVLLTIFFATTTRRNKEENKQIFILIFVLLFLGLIVMFKDNLSNLFDYLVNNVFVLIYFPNLAIYAVALITTTYIMFISVFKPQVIKVIKIINSVVFAIIYYLFFILLGIIKNNNLNIYDNLIIYTNKQAQVTLELSGIIFSLWILFLIIYYFVNNYLKETPINVRPVYEPKNTPEVKPREYINVEDNNFFYNNEKEFSEPITIEPEIFISDISKSKPLELTEDDVLDKLKTKEQFMKLKELLLEYKRLENKQIETIEELNEIVEKNII